MVVRSGLAVGGAFKADGQPVGGERETVKCGGTDNAQRLGQPCAHATPSPQGFDRCEPRFARQTDRGKKR